MTLRSINDVLSQTDVDIGQLKRIASGDYSAHRVSRG